MTAAERRGAAPVFPWADLALAPLDGLLAALPAVVVAGLPVYLVVWLTGLDDPARWVGLVLVGAFALVSAAAIYRPLAGFLRARALVDDDLLDDVVEDRVVGVTGATEVAGDRPSVSLRLDDGTTLVLAGDWVARLRRTGTFPSTTLRLIQLPRSRVVLGVLPLGDTFEPALVSDGASRGHEPV